MNFSSIHGIEWGKALSQQVFPCGSDFESAHGSYDHMKKAKNQTYLVRKSKTWPCFWNSFNRGTKGESWRDGSRTELGKAVGSGSHAIPPVAPHQPTCQHKDRRQVTGATSDKRRWANRQTWSRDPRSRRESHEIHQVGGGDGWMSDIWTCSITRHALFLERQKTSVHSQARRGVPSAAHYLCR